MTLRYPVDARTIAFLTLLAAALASTYALLALHMVPLLWAPAASAALGWLVFVADIVKHNHMHCPTFRERRANVAMNLALTVLTGTSCTGIVEPHNVRHHGAPQSERDFVRSSLVTFRVNALNLALFPFASIVDMVRKKPSELIAWRRRRRRLWRLVVAERATVLAVALTALLVAPAAACFALLLPWLIGQLLLLLMNLLQHQHLDPHDAQRSSRDVVGALSNALLFNAGYHSAHHVQPGAHWSLLPQVHAQHFSSTARRDLEHATVSALLVDRLAAPGRRGAEATITGASTG